MAHAQKSSTSSRGGKSPSGRAPHSSTLASQSASVKGGRQADDKRNAGGGPQTWNRPTQGGNASGPQSFDEEASGPIYGSQSGSNLTKDSGVNENTELQAPRNLKAPTF